jgi:hypothetical protein
MKNLHEILNEYNLNIKCNDQGTDKGDSKSYIDLYYQPLFDKNYKNNQHIKIMEIGVRHGASIKLWKEFFNKATILGIDNKSDEELKDNFINQDWINCEGVEIVYEDAYQKTYSESLTSLYDLMIDDGPHTIESQIKFIKYYKKNLSPEGQMVIEDILTGGLCIFPFLFILGPDLIGSFKDFRWHKLKGDNCIFEVKKASGRMHVFFNRISLVLVGTIYLLVEGPLRILWKMRLTR